MEKWKDIEGYEGIYQVSDQGRVKSLDRDINCNGTHRKFEGKYLKIKNPQGYDQVNLSKEGKQKTCLVHRLVAIAFIENPENKPEVNHIDGCKTNNCLSNLEWNTRSENQQHAVDIGLKDAVKGSNHYSSKLKEEDIPVIFKLKKMGFLNREISDRFKVSASVIGKLLRRKTWKHVKI